MVCDVMKFNVCQISKEKRFVVCWY